MTGEVLKPMVIFEAGRITVQTDVAPLPDGSYSCQNNDFVSITVEVQEAVDNRELPSARYLDSKRAPIPIPWTAEGAGALKPRFGLTDIHGQELRLISLVSVKCVPSKGLMVSSRVESR